jgi:hypothetical protein
VRGRVSPDGAERGGTIWSCSSNTWRDYEGGYPTCELVDGNETLLIAGVVNDDGSDELDRDRQCRTLRVDLPKLLCAVAGRPSVVGD